MEDIDPVELLRRQYLQLLDPEHLTLPKPELLILPFTQSRIFDGMFNEENMAYPPPERYRLRVLKRLIGALEEAIEDPEEDEISDEISECLAQYMAQPLPSASEAAQQKSYVTYTAPSSSSPYPCVTTLETRSLLSSSGTTGLRTWEAALHLGSFLFSPGRRDDFVTDKNILELGAGTGFLSILCTRYLGARMVLATDGSPEIMSDLKTNIGLNGLSDDESIDTSILRWGHTLIGGEADCRAEGRTFDLVIGVDVTYDTHSMPALIATIRDLFELYPHIKVMISAPVRNEDTLRTFLQACDTNGFTTETLHVDIRDSSKQLGFFHPTTPPFSVYLVTNPRGSKDPFAS